jgi:hypothetical protein
MPSGLSTSRQRHLGIGDPHRPPEIIAQRETVASCFGKALPTQSLAEIPVHPLVEIEEAENLAGG